eukprot:CAMPEP_0194514476 /NCGR_PEP_ID=MMETSP0253-20130528/46940_1 /TAXON_ID=2966 /ORGANISM="Noctiluca scintillans" /LENGTH=161 /DNA_ID=CAMNT_0039358137 /DNA_START=412 /DNA_END=899 /DNA_ORIENTATION=-
MDLALTDYHGKFPSKGLIPFSVRQRQKSLSLQEKSDLGAWRDDSTVLARALRPQEGPWQTTSDPRLRNPLGSRQRAHGALQRSAQGQTEFGAHFQKNDVECVDSLQWRSNGSLQNCQHWRKMVHIDHSVGITRLVVNVGRLQGSHMQLPEMLVPSRVWIMH